MRAGRGEPNQKKSVECWAFFTFGCLPSILEGE